MGTMVRLINNYCFDKRLKILTFLDVDNVYTIHNSAIKHEVCKVYLHTHPEFQPDCVSPVEVFDNNYHAGPLRKTEQTLSKDKQWVETDGGYAGGSAGWQCC